MVSESEASISKIACAIRMVASQPNPWGTAARISMMSSRVFASIKYFGGFTLQVARGDGGDEVNWIKRQVEFVRNYWN